MGSAWKGFKGSHKAASEGSDSPRVADAFTAAMATVVRAPPRDFRVVRQEWAAIRIQTAFRGFLVIWGFFSFSVPFCVLSLCLAFFCLVLRPMTERKQRKVKYLTFYICISMTLYFPMFPCRELSKEIYLLFIREKHKFIQ